jgi:putrescine aminotransferase
MEAMHSQGGLPIPGIHHIDQPYWFDEGMMTDMSEEEFGLWAARNSNAPSRRSAKKDRRLHRRTDPGRRRGHHSARNLLAGSQAYPEARDILFVSDEVICGFGRTGEWFGSGYYDMKPDLMAIAKGMTSGYLPMGGVLVSDRIAEVLHNEGRVLPWLHLFRPSGLLRAAIANLTIIKREGLVERVRDQIGPYFQERWKALEDHPMVGQARMVGMFGALELVPDENDLKKRFDNVGKVGTITRDHSFANGSGDARGAGLADHIAAAQHHRGRNRRPDCLRQEDTGCRLE